MATVAKESKTALSYTATGKPGATATPITMAGGTAVGPPTSGAHVKGEVVWDDTGVPWYCMVAGTPGTWVSPRLRTTTIVSSGTPTVNTDLCNNVDITALAAAVTSMTTNLSGTPRNFQPLLYRIKDDGTLRSITWGASFRSIGGTLPLTTIAGKTLYVLLVWNANASVWDCLGTSQEP